MSLPLFLIVLFIYYFVKYTVVDRTLLNRSEHLTVCIYIFLLGLPPHYLGLGVHDVSCYGERTYNIPVFRASYDSIVSVAPNAQQEPLRNARLA